MLNLTCSRGQLLSVSEASVIKSTAAKFTSLTVCEDPTNSNLEKVKQVNRCGLGTQLHFIKKIHIVFVLNVPIHRNVNIAKRAHYRCLKTYLEANVRAILDI